MQAAAAEMWSGESVNKQRFAGRVAPSALIMSCCTVSLLVERLNLFAFSFVLRAVHERKAPYSEHGEG
jgi:hypothetical protein